jgi:hypothetical protein
MKKRLIAVGAVALATAGFGAIQTSTADAGGGRISFALQRSPGIAAAGCLPHAAGRVTVRHDDEVERMTVDAWGLPANTEFDTFVIQVPNFPFGVSWYQGDLETNRAGFAHQEYVGRFNQETFAIAPNTAPAPSVHSSPTPDATTNPAFGPVHTFHVGIWFNSPADAALAGCPNTVTPFNGDHTAGIQALSTRTFANDQGPLRQLVP